MNTNPDVVADYLRNTVEALPAHQCAYCGSHHTVLQDIERSRDVLLFTVFCNSCNLVDRPMLVVREVMKILRAIG